MVEKMTVGENIRNIRKEKGLTQKKLAELCGINEVQIRQYELGKANPKIETISKIADALNVPIGKILIIVNNNKSAEEREKEKMIAEEAEKIIEEFEDEASEINSSHRELELLHNFRKLNLMGEKEAVKRVAELTEIKRYQKGQ